MLLFYRELQVAIVLGNSLLLQLVEVQIRRHGSLASDLFPRLRESTGTPCGVSSLRPKFLD